MKNKKFVCVVALLCLFSFINVGLTRGETIYPLIGWTANAPAETIIVFPDGHQVRWSGDQPYTIHEDVQVYYLATGWVRYPHSPKPHIFVSLRKLAAIRKEPMLGMALIAERRKIMLDYPPAGTVWHRPAGVSQLTAVLRDDGHEVVQRYGHIIGLEHVLATHDAQRTAQALATIRNSHSGIEALYDARMTFEKISRSIPTRDRFVVERNNVVYLSEHQDGTIDGALTAIRNRESHLWYPYFADVEIPLAKDFRPDLYGISIGDERQLMPGLILAAMVKDALPDCVVVLGGNFWPRITDAFRLPKFGRIFDHCDAIVYREGLQPLRELATTLDPSSTSGTIWRDGSNVVINEATIQPTEFESLPTPAFDGGARQWSPDFVASLYTMSNCPMGCGFCAISAGSDTFLSKPRAMSPQKIAEHMMRIGANKFDIVDELFPIQRQIALGEELKRIGYPATWQCYLTVDNRLADPKVCEALYQAGCRSVQLGLETLSPDTLLREYKKWNTPKNYAKILGNLKAAGIHTHVFLMVGLPAEPLHYGLAWTGFLEEYGANILTIKSGRWRLSRQSPDEMKGAHSKFIEVLDDVKPLQVNRNFRYRGTSNTKIDALRDIVEQACRRHWAYGVTSTVPWWVNRSRYTWNELEQMGKRLPAEPDIPHLHDRVAQMRTVVQRELKREPTFNDFGGLADFSRTLL